ncbi:MAG TPA: hypothetical protein VGQ03_01065 [Nitrososphaera sp.]|nr:hypothetical protein [Nitrososphaera sp.]
MRVRYADQVLNLNGFANWLLGYLSKKLLVEVVVPGVSALRHKVMYIILFGWMFHVKTKDGTLVAIWFAKEIRNLQREEMDSIYFEKVEP